MYSITLNSWPEAHQTLTKAAAWIKSRTMAGRPVVLSVGEQKRTLAQNELIQPLVREICALLGRTDHDTVRALLCEQWRHETRRPQQFQPSLDGLRMVDVSNRTSRLDKSDASEFLDWLQAWIAQHE